jgi:hypothetical protein
MNNILQNLNQKYHHQKNEKNEKKLLHHPVDATIQFIFE